MKGLNVFFEQRVVGRLIQDEQLVHSFSYAEEWLNSPERFPLSLAMPLQKEPFGNKISLSFFENLLPEGEVRQAIEKGHDVHGPYDFLKEFGQDCAGAIIVTAKDESPFRASGNNKQAVDMAKVYEAIEQNHSVADIISNMDPGYLSLAGAQDKFAAIVEDGKFYLPLDGGATTHIVKVPIQRSGVKESVGNEFYCMELARTVGFNIPRCSIIDTGHHPLYVIERYDRRVDAKGVVHRVHQQDFCQAHGITSDSKYEAKGGPGIKANYDLIMSSVPVKKRVESVHAYLDWICFNLLIGNNDAHSKNISFIWKDGHVELAPFYDLLSTALYPRLNKQFAFKIGDRDDISQIGKNQFELQDAELGIKKGTLADRMKIVSEKVLKAKDDVAKSVAKQHADLKIGLRIATEISNRVKSLKQQGLEF